MHDSFSPDTHLLTGLSFRERMPGYTVTAYLIILIVLIAPLNSHSQENEHDLLWMEIWGNSSYRKTNFGIKSDSYREEDFPLTILSCNVGLRFPLEKFLFFDPYFNFDTGEDFGNDTWNKAFWNNNMKFGPGVRLRYEYENKENKRHVFRLNNFFIGIFSEYLFMIESLNSSNDPIPDSVHTENYRMGVDSWISTETATINSMNIWGEMWAEISYNTTNYYFKDTHDFYNLALQPRLGIQYKHEKFSIQPYCTLHVSEDFGDKSWNKEPWFNSLQYGPGIRFLFENLRIKEGMVLLVYAESLRIDYLPRVDKTRCQDIHSEDVRICFEFWVPFGTITKGIFPH